MPVIYYLHNLTETNLNMEKVNYVEDTSMLTYVADHHERQIRSTAQDKFYIRRPRSIYFDRSISVQGPKLWNSLLRILGIARLPMGLNES